MSEIKMHFANNLPSMYEDSADQKISVWTEFRISDNRST